MAQRNQSIISTAARIAGLAMLAAAGAMMAGCAEQSSFPSFGTVVPVGNNVLTPEQRQAEMKEMAKEQQTHTGEAQREIEQR